jgi:hypothetical protein
MMAHQKEKSSGMQQSIGRAARRKFTISEENVRRWRQDYVSIFACKAIHQVLDWAEERKTR